MRNRFVRLLPVIIRENLRFLGAILMIKLNIFLCYGTLTNSPEYISAWIYVQMVVQGLDFVIWLGQVLQRQIEFKWITCQKFLAMACNLHVVNTFKLCVQFAIEIKRIL